MSDDLIQKHLGARSELTACIWLLNQGYEVFRNVSQHGECDLIAIKDGEIALIDVKSTEFDSSKLKLKESQINKGIKAIFVFGDGSCRMIEPETMMQNVIALRTERCCEGCSTRFIPRNYKQIFCGKICRSTFHNERYRRLAAGAELPRWPGLEGDR